MSAQDYGTVVGPFVEPHDQGGELYWRCEDCGREALSKDHVHRTGVCDGDSA